MRRRDQVIVLLGFIASFFVWNQEGTIHIANSFLIPFDDFETHTIPKPIVTDLDGDSQPEIVTLTARTVLSVIPSSRVRRSYHDAYVHINPVKQVDLHSNCIGLGTGYLDFFNDTKADSKGRLKRDAVNAEKRQFILVVLDNYEAILYNWELQEMWSQHLIPSMGASMMPYHATVNVMPFRIFKEDRGLVVIGIKVPGASSTEETAYIALHGSDGEIRWRHTTQDYAKDARSDPNNEDPTKNPKYKDVSRLRMTDKELDEHAKEVDWTHFREAVVSALPHQWSHAWDTKLDLHVFFNEKSRNKKAKHHDEHEANLGAGGKHGTARYKGRHFEKETADDYGQLGERYVSARRRQSQRNPPPPNVMVAHTSTGIDIIHLYTGRVITSVKPLNKHSLYHDVDDDYHIDEISARVGPEQHLFGRHGVDEKYECLGTVHSGIPVDKHPVYNVTICDSEGFFPSLLVLEHYIRGDDAKDTPTSDPLSLIGSRPLQSQWTTAVPPIVVQHQAFKGNGIYKVTRDSVFMIDSGLVTSASATSKRVMWRTDTESAFKAKAGAAGEGRTNGDADGAFRSVDEKEARVPVHKPQLAAYHFHSKAANHIHSAKWAHRGNDPVVIAVGDTTLTALNAKTGKIETAVQIPHPPEAPIMIADFNGDGLNDILVMTREGLYGFLVSHKASGSIVSTLMILMVALVLLLYATATMVAVQDESNGGGEDLLGGGSVGVGGVMGGGSEGKAYYRPTAKSKRATD